MKIISAKQGDKTVDREQILRDLPAIKKSFQEGAKKEPTLEFFGCIIWIEDRTYQVAP